MMLSSSTGQCSKHSRPSAASCRDRCHVAGVAYGECAATVAAYQVVPGVRPGLLIPSQYHFLAIGALLLQALQVLKKLLPGDVFLMMRMQADAPVCHGHRMRPFQYLPGGIDLAAILISAIKAFLLLV